MYSNNRNNNGYWGTTLYSFVKYANSDFYITLTGFQKFLLSIKNAVNSDVNELLKVLIEVPLSYMYSYSLQNQTPAVC